MNRFNKEAAFTLVAILGLVLLFLAPILWQEVNYKRDLATFVNEGFGLSLADGDKVIYFKSARNFNGMIAFCKYEKHSPISATLIEHGPLPDGARDVIRNVSQGLIIDPSQLPDLSAASLDYEPKGGERAWVAIYDLKVNVIWIFKSA